MEVVVQRQALMQALEFLNPYIGHIICLSTMPRKNALVVSGYNSDLSVYLHKVIQADIKKRGTVICYKNPLLWTLEDTTTETVNLKPNQNEKEFYINDKGIFLDNYEEQERKFPHNFEPADTNELKEAFEVMVYATGETCVWFFDVLRLERDMVIWTPCNFNNPKKPRNYDTSRKQVFYKLYSTYLNDTYIFTKKLATALCKLNEPPPVVYLGRTGSIEDGQTFIQISEDFYLSAYYEYNEPNNLDYDFSKAKEIRAKNIKTKLKELLNHDEVAVLIDKGVIKYIEEV